MSKPHRPALHPSTLEDQLAAISCQHAIDLIGEGIYQVDLQGRVKFVNAMAARMMGEEPQDLLGRRVDSLFSYPVEQTCSLSSDNPKPPIRTLHRSDGTIVIVTCKSSPIRDPDGKLIGIIVVIRDATDRIAVEKIAQQKHQQLAMAMKAGLVSVWEWEPHSDFYQGSYGFGELLGFAPEEFEDCGTDFADRLHPDDRDYVWNSLGKHLAGEAAYEVEFRLRCKNGEYRWFRCCGESERDADGNVTRMNGTLSDVTRGKEAELELRRQLKQRDHFLAMLSHELRNPMGAVANAVSHVQLRTEQHGFDGQCHQSLQLIQDQTRHMSRLLNDLLDVARITNNKIEYQKVCFDLRTNCLQAIEAVKHLFDAKQQQLDISMGTESIVIKGDPDRIRQAQINLLSNASRFTPKAGRIKLTLRVTDDQAVLEFTDSGIGLDQAEAEQIFELFGQVEGGLSRSSGGMGVGLSLAKPIMEAHDGSISVHSDGPGTGSTFTLTLPVSKHRSIASPTSMAYRFHELKLLLVDDATGARMILSRVLAQQGMQVIQAETGEAAMDRAERDHPLVAVIDIGLPEMSGYEVATRLRRRHGESIQLIALTGYGREEDKQKSYQAGFDAHLVKPLDPPDLYQLIADRWPENATRIHRTAA